MIDSEFEKVLDWGMAAIFFLNITLGLFNLLLYKLEKMKIERYRKIEQMEENKRL